MASGLPAIPAAMDLQQTLRQPVTLAGIGLHSGEPVEMTVSPAGADTRILFRAADGTLIPTNADHVVDTHANSHPISGLQGGTYGITEDVFAQELAPARTYGFLRDVPAMRQNGLARGGSLENAVVVGKRSVLNDSLRYPDEFVRHKILDLVGDLFLLGRPLRALVVGRNAGHALNYQLVSAIQKAVAADRRRSVARVIRSAAPVPVASTGDGFLPGVAAL